MDFIYIRSTEDPSFVHNERVNRPIRCTDVDLQRHIHRWTQSEGWAYKDFAILAELLGFSLPITLKDPATSKNEFGFEVNEFTIKSRRKTANCILYFGDAMDFGPSIKIIEKKRFTHYVVGGSKGNFEARLDYQEIESAYKTLKTWYSTYGVKRVLTFANGNVLEVNVKEPGGSSFDAVTAKVLENVPQINGYLFGIPKNTTNLDAERVLTQIMKKYCFDSELMSQSEDIQVKFTGADNIVYSEMKYSNGKCLKFTTTSCGQTYYIESSGNWKYRSNTMNISYIAGEERDTCCFDVCKENISTCYTKLRAVRRQCEQYYCKYMDKK